LLVVGVERRGAGDPSRVQHKGKASRWSKAWAMLGGSEVSLLDVRLWSRVSDICAMVGRVLRGVS
jgi:hypothetical protein